MPTRRIRLTAVLSALATVVLLAYAAGASAAITSSHITSPGDTSYFLEDTTASPSEITIRGTVEGKGELEIRCYSGTESTEVARVEEEELTKVGPGKFEFSVEEVAVEEFGEAPCLLRAVPAGNKEALTPGVATPFEGPRVAYSEFARFKDAVDSTYYSYDLEARTLASVFEISGAGICGLGETALVSSPSLTESAELFSCAGALYGAPAGAGRSDIQVDGHNVYEPLGADAILNRVKPANSPPGITVEKTFEASTGLMTLHETDPLVECEGSTTAFPETKESCERFVSAGVSLERTWTPSNGGRLISMTDTWRSTDAKPHTVGALYVHELASDPVSPGTYEFPGGAAVFATTKTGQTQTLTAGEGAILYRENGTGEEVLGAKQPVGAITFDTTPSGPLQVTAGTAETTGIGVLQMPYTLELGASGTRKLTMAFAQGYTLAEVCALAEQAESGCQPSVAISSPVSGATSSSPSVTVSGTASDQVLLSSLKVNGQAVSVSGGAWTTKVSLAPGPNTITALARNAAGLTRSVTTSVTYTESHPPAEEEHRTPPPPPPPPTQTTATQTTATASRVGPAHLLKGNLTVAVACNGPGGTSCTVKATLSTVEKLRGGRPSSLAAPAAAPRTKTVTVGSVSATIAAGTKQTITIKLNATGRSLLARFHKLPAHLAVAQQGVAKAIASIVALNLTITAKHR